MTTVDEQYLATLERGIRAMMSRTSSGVLVLCDGRIVHTNPRALMMLRQEELVGKNYVDLVAEDLRAGMAERLAQAAREGHSDEYGSILVRADDTRVRVDGMIAAGLWDGKPALYVHLVDRGDVGPQPQTKRQRVLVVDDEVVIGNVVRRILRDYDVMHVTAAAEAVELLARESFDVILCDVMLPGMSGIDLFEAVSRAEPHLLRRFIFVTGGAFTQRARDFLASVPNARIDKPFDASVIRDAVAALARS
jgi:PAS domain S-box-containing protein